MFIVSILPDGNGALVYKATATATAISQTMLRIPTATTLACFLAAIFVVTSGHGGGGRHNKHGGKHGKMAEFKKQCINETGTSAEEMEQMDADWKSKGEPTKELTCFWACMLEKKGKMTASGDLVLSDHCPEDLKEKLKACVPANTGDKCQSALAIKKCMDIVHDGKKNRRNHKKEEDDEGEEEKDMADADP